MNETISMFATCVEGIIYVLYNLHDFTSNTIFNGC